MKTKVRIKTNPKIKIIEEENSLLFPVYSYIKKDEYHEGYVYKNFLIGEYYTTVSGEILGTKKMYFNGYFEECLEIKNNFKETMVENPYINKEFDSLKKEDFLSLLKEKDLGYLYNSCNKDSKILIINTIDNVYEYNNIFNIKNNKENILDYINKIGKILNVDKIIILFRNSSEIGIESFVNLIGLYSNMEIKLIPNIYITDINDFINMDNYIMLSSIDILNIINNCLYNKRLDSKYISIYDIENNIIKVILVKKYTSLLEVLDNIEDKDIYYNGLYLGYKIKDIDKYLVDDLLNSIFLVPKNYKINCINCGACNKVCPKNIDVYNHLISKCKSDNCINCGLCNYICPSNINIRDILTGENYEE